MDNQHLPKWMDYNGQSDQSSWKNPLRPRVYKRPVRRIRNKKDKTDKACKRGRALEPNEAKLLPDDKSEQKRWLVSYKSGPT